MPAKGENALPKPARTWFHIVLVKLLSIFNLGVDCEGSERPVHRSAQRYINLAEPNLECFQRGRFNNGIIVEVPAHPLFIQPAIY